jgi:hypothetical protein
MTDKNENEATSNLTEQPSVVEKTRESEKEKI